MTEKINRLKRQEELATPLAWKVLSNELKRMREACARGNAAKLANRKRQKVTVTKVQ